jgi:hypothetical protein
MQVFSDVYSIWGYVWGSYNVWGVTNWKSSQIALRAFVSLCGGLWWGGVRYCCGRLSGGLCGGLRALLFLVGWVFSQVVFESL